MADAVEARITDDALDPRAEFDAFLAALGGEGGVATFTGLARPSSIRGAAVERLFLDHHPVLTEQSVRQIAADARQRFGVSAVRVVHRIGEVGSGDAIVFVAAASAHRRAAFEAADYMMDRLKTQAVFWKREDTAIGSNWIEPTEADHADTQRWSD
ncbi:molybdenum cofactor biosynthesis protein MoaE [Tsuneonella deserti]|uniref:Molybdopterin synthase catalytic subunit n=1 Tax=Tsuneonella deserti TaxID=2035528 RepID=A0ABQ1SCD3_9SPHN|nr:molybdenum cofactor biosynthesis protein MoaE [Tsuneonella deserti]GGE00204.1 molybdenum cofactor biosynthesis protein MoaE [Tsuneonella deserti]